MEKPHSDKLKAMLRLADERLAAAKRDLKADDYRGTANRSYYAMFHAASALLTALQIKFKTHKSTVGLFGLHVVQAGIMDEEYGRWLNQALDLREVADYKVETDIDEAEAQELVDNAGKFVSGIKGVLKVKHNIG